MASHWKNGKFTQSSQKLYNMQYPINKTKLHNSFSRYEPLFESHSAHIEIGQDGISPVYPIEYIEKVLLENEMLREELCEQQNNIVNITYHTLKYNMRYSKQEINNKIKKIMHKTNNVLTENDIWALIKKNFIPLSAQKLMKSNETLLDFMWRTELLPVLSIYINIFEELIDTIDMNSPTSLRQYFDGISKNLQNKNKNKKYSL